jgi:hypothetical protein
MWRLDHDRVGKDDSSVLLLNSNNLIKADHQICHPAEDVTAETNVAF